MHELQSAREYNLKTMTEEKLKKAEELIKRIKRLIEQRKKWEEADAIHRIEFSTVITHYGSVRYIGDIDNSFINFEDIKLLALAKIQSRIYELQKEFDAL